MSPVLVLATQVGRRANGGLASLTELLTGLTDLPITAASQAESDFTAAWRAAGLRVVILPELGAILPATGARKLAAIAACNRAVARLLRDTGARLVHCNDLSALWGAAIAARAAGAGLLFNIRDTTNVAGAKWRLAVALADRTVVNSADMAARIARALVLDPALRARLTHVHSIVDLRRFAPADPAARAAARRARAIPDDTFAAVLVGGVIPRKQQLPLVQALAAQPTCLPAHARLYLVGDSDPEVADYRAEVARALGSPAVAGRVELRDFDPDVAGWYQAADVVLVASRAEGMARCMIEALACGTPVVSFDVASAREILNDSPPGPCGAVVAQDDFPALLCTAAGLASDQRHRQALGRAGRAVAERLLSRERATAAYRALYAG